MQLQGLAYIVGMLPIVAAYTAYAIAIEQGHLPACFPNLSGCTSISAAGRQTPESLLFRGAMITSALLMALFWLCCRQWLMNRQRSSMSQHLMLTMLGLLSSAFLLIYSVALGQIGDVYATYRRIGVTLFFSCGLLAQLLLTKQVYKLVRLGELQLRGGLHKYLLLLCAVMILFGLAIVPMSILFPGDSRADYIVEWNYAVLMYLYFIVVGRIWSVTGFSVRFEAGGH